MKGNIMFSNFKLGFALGFFGIMFIIACDAQIDVLGSLQYFGMIGMFKNAAQARNHVIKHGMTDALWDALDAQFGVCWKYVLFGKDVEQLDNIGLCADVEFSDYPYGVCITAQNDLDETIACIACIATEEEIEVNFKHNYEPIEIDAKNHIQISYQDGVYMLYIVTQTEFIDGDYFEHTVLELEYDLHDIFDSMEDAFHEARLIKAGLVKFGRPTSRLQLAPCEQSGLYDYAGEEIPF